MNRYFVTLELDKILQRLADKTSFEAAHNRALEIKPNYSFEVVKKEIQKTSDANMLSIRFGEPSFSRLKDPKDSVKICQAGGVVSPLELLSFAAIWKQARLFRDWKRQTENAVTVLDTYFEAVVPNKEVELRITDAILSENEIADSASDDLYQIRRKIKGLQKKVRDQLDQIVRNKTRYLQEAIVTIRDDRFVVPVKAEHRGEVPGVVHDSSASGATLFVEPNAVVESNNAIRALQAQEEEEIRRILAELSALCADYADDLLLNFDIAVEINLLFAKARLAQSMRASAPLITDDGIIDLKQARHPLIDPNKVVPVDVTLGKEYHCMVITGPNTGGKTVTLKTIGLLTLMTLCGLLIPAADTSTVSVFDRVLIDIGDEQSIEQSLSTFSAHMKNIISILKRADRRSLVLLDELGSGTDPVEGAALATAILEHFREKGCRLAATTHYSELKVYALQTAGVCNACCEFDVATLRPTYRLLIGIPGKSNAFAISERLGLPKPIIEEAEQLISREHKEFEDVVHSLENTRQQFEREQQEYTEQNRKIANLNRQLKEQREELEREKEREIQLARQEATRLVQQVKAQSQALLDELDDIRKAKDREDFRDRTMAAKSTLRNRLGKLDDLANPVAEHSNEGYQLPRALQIGDSVQVVDIDKQGTVLGKVDSSGKVQVQTGILKMHVPVENLRLVEQKKVQFQGRTNRKIVSNAKREIKTEVDLRGFTVEEALMDLDQFIDNAVMSGVNVIHIIHGKGTGALRAAIQQHLRHHKSIASFRLGTYGEGESGVTVAELK